MSEYRYDLTLKHKCPVHIHKAFLIHFQKTLTNSQLVTILHH